MTIQLLHKKLIQKKLTISVAESCTGGLLAHNLTKLANSSKYFQMGLTTYSNEAKIKILKVNKNVIKNLKKTYPNSIFVSGFKKININLILEGLSAGDPTVTHEVVSLEVEAIKHAISLAKEGTYIVALSDVIDNAIDIVQNYLDAEIDLENQGPKV